MSRTKAVLHTALALVTSALVSLAAFAGEVVTRKLSVGGTERMYLLSTSVTGGPRPAIIVLHGGGMSANSALRSTGLEPLIARENLIGIYPNAFRREWNDGREARLKARENSDDVGFIRALVKSLIADNAVDPKRIYVTGPSNGGMMTLRLICDAADLFAAAAPIIASLPADIATTCKPSRAVPVLIINGTADPLVPYAGGGVGIAGRRGRVISTDATMTRLRGFNGCSDMAKTERLPDLDPNDGSTVTVTGWTSLHVRRACRPLSDRWRRPPHPASQRRKHADDGSLARIGKPRFRRRGSDLGILPRQETLSEVRLSTGSDPA